LSALRGKLRTLASKKLAPIPINSQPAKSEFDGKVSQRQAQRAARERNGREPQRVELRAAEFLTDFERGVRQRQENASGQKAEADARTDDKNRNRRQAGDKRGRAAISNDGLSAEVELGETRLVAQDRLTDPSEEYRGDDCGNARTDHVDAVFGRRQQMRVQDQRDKTDQRRHHVSEQIDHGVRTDHPAKPRFSALPSTMTNSVAIAKSTDGSRQPTHSHRADFISHWVNNSGLQNGFAQ